MSSVDQAYETQLKNIQSKTGKTLDQLYAVIQKSGLAKHGEIRDRLKRDLGLGHGDANTLTTTHASRYHWGIIGENGSGCQAVVRSVTWQEKRV